MCNIKDSLKLTLAELRNEAIELIAIAAIEYEILLFISIKAKSKAYPMALFM